MDKCVCVCVFCQMSRLSLFRTKPKKKKRACRGYIFSREPTVYNRESFFNATSFTQLCCFFFPSLLVENVGVATVNGSWMAVMMMMIIIIK